MISAISVKDRLKNKAVSTGKTFQETLIAYALERTIYRLSVSEYVEQFTLKGGMFLYSLAYQKYFGDKYSYEDFKAAYDRLSQNIKEFTELKEMEYAAITHHEDVEYQHDVKYFKAEEVALSESLKEYISRIIKIHRLREV